MNNEEMNSIIITAESTIGDIGYSIAQYEEDKICADSLASDMLESAYKLISMLEEAGVEV